jgi:hypothetical protein
MSPPERAGLPAWLRRLILPSPPALPRSLAGWPWPGRGGWGGSGGAPLVPHQARLGAWEAELAAYGRWRTGNAGLTVRFGLATGASWGEEVVLARPPAHLPPERVLAGAEAELEHLLAHHRHGWREVALLWQLWAEPATPIVLPWPPWEDAPLPPTVVGQALAGADPVLVIPPARAGAPERQRAAAVWVYAAWADGLHRQTAVAERPGLAERLPLPPAGAPRRGLWEDALYRLATRDGEGGAGAGAGSGAALPKDGGREVEVALAALLGAGPAGPAVQIGAVLDLVDALARRGAVPPAHRQRPPWLGRAWGRWQREARLRQALDRLARSPTSAAVAAATAAGRLPGVRRAAPPGAPAAAAPPAAVARLATSGSEAGGGADEWGVVGEDGPRGADPAEPEWGLPEGETPPGRAPGAGVEPEPSGRSGQWGTGAGGAGAVAGAGALGELHVVQATAADRAAYWELRGALAPEIERLVEGLRAAGEDYDVATPGRFQRAGRLDRARLPAALAGRPTVFVRFRHQPEPAHALCLLLDCSASMTTLADRLREAAIVVESAAGAVGARVSAFTFGADWERLEPPAEGAPLVALGRELHPHGGTPFGPAVAAASDWLARQPFERRRLWVFSDGQWTARDRAGARLRPEQLRDVVVWVLGDAAGEADAPGLLGLAGPAGAAGAGGVPGAAGGPGRPGGLSPLLRVTPVASLAELVRLAPAQFWRPPGLRKTRQIATLSL